MSALRVLVVDDDESVRRLLLLALPLWECQAHVVGEARDGDEAIALALALRPDVIVLDHVMPHRSGADAVPDIRRVSPESEILMFSAYLDSPEFEGDITRVARTYGVESVPKGRLEDLEAALDVMAERRTHAHRRSS